MFPNWYPWPTVSFSQYQLHYNNPFSQRVIPGWYQSLLIYALDLGEITSPPENITPASVYIPITGFDREGTPLPVEGQYYVFTEIPASRKYTGFFRVVFPLVPTKFQPNSLRSKADIEKSGYQLFSSDLILLLPLL
jgi:hypothetical protein